MRLRNRVRIALLEALICLCGVWYSFASSKYLYKATESHAEHGFHTEGAL